MRSIKLKFATSLIFNTVLLCSDVLWSTSGGLSLSELEFETFGDMYLLRFSLLGINLTCFFVTFVDSGDPVFDGLLCFLPASRSRVVDMGLLFSALSFVYLGGDAAVIILRF